MEKPVGLLQAENTLAEKLVSDRLFFPLASSRLRKHAHGKASTEIYSGDFSARVCASRNSHMENGPDVLLCKMGPIGVERNVWTFVNRYWTLYPLPKQGVGMLPTFSQLNALSYNITLVCSPTRKIYKYTRNEPNENFRLCLCQQAVGHTSVYGRGWGGQVERVCFETSSEGGNRGG